MDSRKLKYLQLTFFVSQTHSQIILFLFLLGFDNNYFQACFEYSAHEPIQLGVNFQRPSVLHL